MGSVTQFTGAVVVCCRDSGRYTAFWESLYGLKLPPGLAWSQPGGVALIRSSNPSIAAARNNAVTLAQSMGCQWLLWLDDDQLAMPDTLLKFLAHPEEIVVGLTLFRFSQVKNNPDRFAPQWSQRWHDGRVLQALTHVPAVEANGLVPLTWATMGGVLTRMSVFDKIEGPWFTCGNEGPSDQVWEDIAFYKAAADAGIQVWGDPQIRFGHMTTTTIWPQYHQGQWSTVFAWEYEPFIAMNWPDPAPAVSTTAPAMQTVEV